jgi:hypothetical protein
MRQVISTRSSAESVISNSAVRYMPFCTQTAFFATTEDIAQAPCATAGTFSNLVIRLATAPGGAASRTYVVRKNGVDTAMTVVISGSNTTARDTTNSITVAAGDVLSMSTTPSGTPDSAGLTGNTFIDVEFVGTTAAESGYGWAPAALSTTATRWNGLFSGWTWSSTSGATTHNVVAAAGTIAALYITLTGTPGAGKSYAFTIYKNGVAQNGGGGTPNTTVTIADAATSGNSSFSLSVSPGDLVYLECVPTGTPTSRQAACGVRFVATTDGQYQVCGLNLDALNTVNDAFTRVHGRDNDWETTEAAGSLYGGVTDFSLSGLQVVLDGSPGAGNNYIFSLRRNTASPAGTPSVTIAESATTGSDTTGSVNIADGDIYALRSVPTSSPTARTAAWAFIGGDSVILPDPPTAFNDAYSTPFETLLTINAASGVLANDIQNGGTGALTAALVDDVTDGTLALAANGSFTYTPDNDFTGTDSFTYRASDSAGTSNLATATITVGAAPGTIPLNPLIFVNLKLVNGTEYFLAQTPLNDSAAWYGGRKPAKLLNISTFTRSLTRQGATEAVRATITFADTDRTFRALAAEAPLRGALVIIYAVDDAVRRAEGAPFERFMGTVVDHKAADGFRYEIEVEDIIGLRLTDFNKQPLMPPDRFKEFFPTVQDGDRAIPVVVGTVSDEDDAVPQGAVQAIYVGGPVNFQAVWGGINVDTDAFILTQGALPSGGTIAGYYNNPTTPDARVGIPASSYGVDLWVPWQTDWTADTGLATQYVDYWGRRWTPVFVNRSLGDLAEAAREGRTIIAFNLKGMETVGDGTGPEITAPPNQWQWLYENYVFTRYTTGNYASPATFDDDAATPLIDAASVTAAQTTLTNRIAGGYLTGFVMGRDGQQSALFDQLQELLEGSDMDQGINRKGQLMLSVENTTAAASVSYTAQSDILDGEYEVWIDSAGLANRIQHNYKYRHVEPSAPRAVPAEGTPMAVRFTPTGRWGYGVRNEDTGAQASIGGEIATYELENYVVRDQATGADIEGQLLRRGLGAANDGPRMFRFTTGWQGFGKNGVEVELGSVISVSHPARIGSSETTVDTCRVLSITDDLMGAKVTLQGMVLAPSIGVYVLPIQFDETAATMAVVVGGESEAVYQTDGSVQPVG